MIQTVSLKNYLYIFLFLCISLTSGCTTLASEYAQPSSPDELLKQNLVYDNDKKLFDLKLNSIKDNIPVIWQGGKDNKINFELTLHNTHVNSQGLPCREYVLLIDKDSYYRHKTVQGIACRYEDHWGNQKNNIE